MHNHVHKILTIVIAGFLLLGNASYADNVDQANAAFLNQQPLDWQANQQSIREYRLQQWQAQQQNPQGTNNLQPEPVSRQQPAAPRVTPEADDLFAAATSGNTDQISRILSQGLDINISNSERETSLHMAAARGHYSAVIYLVKHGAYVNAPTVKKWIPLHHAVRFKHPNIVNYLIKHGAAPHSRTSDGLTAVDMARNAQDYRLLSILGAR